MVEFLLQYPFLHAVQTRAILGAFHHVRGLSGIEDVGDVNQLSIYPVDDLVMIFNNPAV
jgi:hypothetical protein